VTQKTPHVPIKTHAALNIIAGLDQLTLPVRADTTLRQGPLALLWIATSLRGSR